MRLRLEEKPPLLFPKPGPVQNASLLRHRLEACATVFFNKVCVGGLNPPTVGGLPPPYAAEIAVDIGLAIYYALPTTRIMIAPLRATVQVGQASCLSGRAKPDQPLTLRSGANAQQDRQAACPTPGQPSRAEQWRRLPACGSAPLPGLFHVAPFASLRLAFGYEAQARREAVDAAERG